MPDTARITDWLFQTQALRISPADQPFWYTSGNIGPYYINTHYLYGSGQKAEELLRQIDALKADKLDCCIQLARLTYENYCSDPIFHELIDGMAEEIRTSLDVNEISAISGGERRDWFFSYPLARILGKPHIAIHKDLDMVSMTPEGEVAPVADGQLQGQKLLHIADLVTEASSYERAWIPAIQRAGAKLCWTHYVIDRLQGGAEVFSRANVMALPMVCIDQTLFDQALRLGYINEQQYALLRQYLDNPNATMRTFLLEHPDFLPNALAADAKTAERARLCIEKDFYGLKGAL